MDDWETIGTYRVRITPDHFRIFPKDAEGKTRPVWVKRVYVELQKSLETGHVVGVTFKHYLHQRNLYWADLRREEGKQSCPSFHVRRELARLLFEGDRDKANRLMERAEALI